MTYNSHFFMRMATFEMICVATWSVDRLGRSLTDLLGILQGLHEKGVGLFLHQQGLDTSTTAGKAMFQMLGVFAEFERGIIRERVNAGLARAKANGTKLGRRRVKPSVEARILELRANGDGILKIGRKLGVGTSVVQRVVAATRRMAGADRAADRSPLSRAARAAAARGLDELGR